MKKALSFLAALPIALLAIAPPLNYNIPVVVHAPSWLYAVVVCGFLCMLFWHLDAPFILKLLYSYLLLNCFLSQIPYISFNAFVLLTASIYLYWVYQKCDFSIIINVVVAVFWFEVFIVLIQRFEADVLMSFKTPGEMAAYLKALGIQSFNVDSRIFYGTVFQPMRLGSLFAIMSPLLLTRSKWYIVPLLILSYLSGTLGFVFALLVGVLVYLWCVSRNRKVVALATLAAIVFGAICTVFTSDDAFRVAITEGRLPVWWVCIKSWVLDTTGPMGPKDWFGISQTGPVDWMRFVFGHGADTFLPLFPIYKHDPNPFPQAHNDWIQLAWETGLVGFSLFSVYCIRLIKRLYDLRLYLLIAGLSIIAVNMSFAFPWRMTQTVLLMVVYVAYCEKKIRDNRINPRA